jgi:hypothetical protein
MLGLLVSVQVGRGMPTVQSERTPSIRAPNAEAGKIADLAA